MAKISLRDLVAKPEAKANGANANATEQAAVDTSVHATKPKVGNLSGRNLGAETQASTAPKLTQVAKPAPEAPEEPAPISPSTEELARTNITAAEFNHPSQKAAIPSKDVESFKESIAVLHGSFENKELISAAIANVLGSLKANPNLREILAYEDVGMMVRALRESYGVAVNTKAAKATKTKKASAEQSEIMEMLSDLEIDLG